jgi:hypothetical protein
MLTQPRRSRVACVHVVFFKFPSDLSRWSITVVWLGGIAL